MFVGFIFVRMSGVLRVRQITYAHAFRERPNHFRVALLLHNLISLHVKEKPLGLAESCRFV